MHDPLNVKFFKEFQRKLVATSTEQDLPWKGDIWSAAQKTHWRFITRLLKAHHWSVISHFTFTFTIHFSRTHLKFLLTFLLQLGLPRAHPFRFPDQYLLCRSSFPFMLHAWHNWSSLIYPLTDKHGTTLSLQNVRPAVDI